MKNIISIYLLWTYAGASGFTQTLPTENSFRTSRLRVQQQPSSKITLASDNELLLSSFNNLREDEKYDTVLTGLCSKLLDDPNKADYIASGAVSNFAKLEEPLKLLAEMNSRNVPVTYRACSALLDVAGSCEDVQVMSTVMTLLRRNRDSPINNYGERQRDLTQYPTNQSKKQQRLSNVPKIPTDDRASEISSALSVLSVAAACFLADPLAKLFGGTDAGPLPNLVLFVIISVGVLDNFYDVLSGTANLVDKAPKMPEKGNLPMGLGNGQLLPPTLLLASTGYLHRIQKEHAKRRQLLFSQRILWGCHVLHFNRMLSRLLYWPLNHLNSLQQMIQIQIIYHQIQLTWTLSYLMRV
mmetsp:Transcript_469/g.755  ORF Transcript_469/g.755 Transcript_469/m.755 type:complete len:355 (-) Transcript_469:417-1481(-)